MTRESPLRASVCTANEAEMTLGTSAVSVSRSRAPASKYGDDGFHLTHNRYKRAEDPLPLTVTTAIFAETYALEVDVLDTDAGLVELGKKHDDAITKADPSLVTFGIQEPLTVTS